MAPDYIYYIFPPREFHHFGHTRLGLFVFCIPVGLAVLLAFHALFKRPLVLLMPRGLRDRLWPYCGPFPVLPLWRLAWISSLIYLGAVTHVLWDGVTHEDGWAFRDFPQMHGALFTIRGRPVDFFGLLQFISSVCGLGLLAWWSWRWYCEAPIGRAPEDGALLRIGRPAIVVVMLAIAVAVGICCGLVYVLRLPAPFAIREFCAAAFLNGADALVLTLTFFCIALNLSKVRRQTVREWSGLS
jgi:hypothetical protein